MPFEVELCLAEYRGQTSLLVSGAPSNADMSVVPSELVGRAGRWQATAGEFAHEDGASWFVPRFPLVHGVSYSLLIDTVESARIVVPASPLAPNTDVISIHPTAVEVPLNLLRVYVSFSAPISEGSAARSVSVRRLDTGERLTDVFVQMEPELWDRSRRRLTLLLEPGRIKRGLVPNLESGPPLTEGVAVAVVVDRSLSDAAGKPLRKPAERRYHIGPAIRARVDPLAWRLTAPAAPGSREPLVVDFDRPLDVALLRRCLVVLDSATCKVPGDASTDDGDRVWRFAPTSPWGTGSHTLRVDTRLEDVAGNSVRRIFDRDLTRADHEPLEVDFVRVPFTIS